MIKRTSLKDIASQVGVSSALVSYVLNGKNIGRINKTVAQKIRDTAKELNYRTNQIARSLKTNKTNTIGLIVADISNPFSASMARIIEDEAAKENYTVIFGSSDEHPFKSEKLIEAFLNRQVDGLIIAPRENTEYLVEDLTRQSIPFVLVDRYFPSINSNYVAIDNYSASYDAVSYLLNNSYSTVAMINYRTSLHNLNERSRGYQAAIAANKPGHPVNFLKEVEIDNLGQNVRNAIDQLSAGGVRPEAMIFASNEIAFHAVKYIKLLNIKVPEEIGLISFDEIAAWDLFYAPLTYVKQPLHEMGQLATRILLESMKDTSKTQQFLVPGELIIRESTRR